MLPEVAHIILVEQPFPRAETKVSEENCGWVILKEQTAKPSNTVVFAVDAEAVEVEILPAHCTLNDGVEFGNGGIALDQQSPPDVRRDTTERDVELVDRERL